MSRFAKICPVLYVERPVSLFSFFTGIADASVGRQFRRWIGGGLRKEGENLYVLTPPPCLPFRYHPLINRINQYIRTVSVKRAIKRLGLSNIVLFVYEPDAAHMLGKLKEKINVYFCADEWTGSRHWWNPTKYIIKCEQNLLTKSNIVMVVSQSLFSNKKQFAKNIYYIPNGVSYSDFSQSQRHPEDIIAISKPIIGCSALYNDRYDYSLLEKAARTHKDLSFVFVGKVIARGTSINRLREFPNAHFLGNKSLRSLGGYIEAFDVCLVPYKPTLFNDSAFPLKLMEYFFYGKPVVSLRLSSLKEYTSLVYQYSDEGELEEALLMALAENDPAKMQERQAIALRNTWEARTEEVAKIIENHLR